MKNLSKIVIIAAILICLPGCNKKQLDRTDRTIADANDVVSGIGALLESPAGGLLPPDLRIYGAAGIAIASIALNSWQKVRSNLMTKTTKAIVKGIEREEKACGKPNPVNPIKESIGQEMIAAGIFDKGNQIVDQLKISR